MGFWSWLFPGAREVPRLAASSVTDRAREEFLVGEKGIVSDGSGWGPTSPDATEAERSRLRNLSRKAYRQAGIYGQMVDIYVGWILGDGVVVKAAGEKADAHLQAVLNDPANAFHRRLRERVRRLFVDGEYPITVYAPVREGTGEGGPAVAQKVRFGNLLPESIAEVKVLAYDHGTPVSLMIEKGAGEQEEFPIARSEVEPKVVKEEGAPPIAVAVCWWRVNVITVRGLPLFSRTVDKASLLDRTVEEMGRKAEFTNRFWVLITYKPWGDKQQEKALEAEIVAWVKSAKAGEIAAFPNGADMKVVAPDLKLPDFKALYEIMVDWILGSHGIPRMWFSSGGDTNRATSVEQGTPIARQIKGHQSDVQALIEDLCRYVLYLGERAGVVPQEQADDVEVVMPDVASRDSMRDVTELTGIITALNEFAAVRAISPLERQKIARKVLSSKVYGDQLEPDAPTLEDEDGVALNPAQVGVLQGIVREVSAGEIPKEAAREMLVGFFQIAAETAEALLAPAEEFAGDAQKAQDEAAKRAAGLLKADQRKQMQGFREGPAAKSRTPLREALRRILPGHRRGGRFTTRPDGTRLLEAEIPAGAPR